MITRLAAATLCCVLLVGAGDSLGAGPAPESLVGTWIVDLRPTPDSPAYLQEMVILSVEDGSIEGSFYGSAIEDGRINEDWGPVRFAFVTEDGSGRYHTSGTLDGDRMSGTTHSLGRDFLSVWQAERSTP